MKTGVMKNQGKFYVGLDSLVDKYEMQYHVNNNPNYVICM